MTMDIAGEPAAAPDPAPSSVQLSLTTISPLHIGAAPAEGNVLRTLPYIPGGTLRGALANHYRHQLGEDGVDDDFFSWAFLSGEVRWPDLRWDSEMFLPCSISQCKDDDGRADHEEKHPYVDAVWSYPAPAEYCSYCPEEEDGGKTLLEKARPQLPKRRLITRTALTPETRSAVDGTLHTIEVIDEGQTLTGLLTTARDLTDDSVKWERLIQWLNDVADAPPAIGGGRSRGLGEIALGVQPMGSEPLPSVAERFAAWNAASAGDDSPRRQFALTMESPILLRDHLWRWRRSLPAEALAEHAPAEATETLRQCSLLAAWTQATTVAGWNQAAGVPRTPALAIDRGSVFLYRVPPEVDDDALIAALSALECARLGERLAEGYGFVVVCHPQHQALHLSSRQKRSEEKP